MTNVVRLPFVKESLHLASQRSDLSYVKGKSLIPLEHLLSLCQQALRKPLLVDRINDGGMMRLPVMRQNVSEWRVTLFIGAGMKVLRLQTMISASLPKFTSSTYLKRLERAGNDYYYILISGSIIITKDYLANKTILYSPLINLHLELLL